MPISRSKKPPDIDYESIVADGEDETDLALIDLEGNDTQNVIAPPRQLPLKKTLPVGQNKPKTPLSQNPNQDGGNDNPGGGNIPTYEIPEQDNVTVDIEQLYNVYKSKLNDWAGTDGKCDGLIKFLRSGKNFSDQIKVYRQRGIHKIKVADIVININPDQNKILSNYMTKQRFMAVVHKHLFENGIDFTSPLVMRVYFDPNNPLTQFKTLLGAGLQFNHRCFTRGRNTPSDKAYFTLLFYVSCMLMDYLSYTNPNSEKYDEIHGLDFKEYVLGEHAVYGDVFTAGSRNKGDIGMSSIQGQNLSTTLGTVLDSISVGRIGKQSIMKNLEGFQKLMNERTN